MAMGLAGLEVAVRRQIITRAMLASDPAIVLVTTIHRLDMAVTEVTVHIITDLIIDLQP